MRKNLIFIVILAAGCSKKPVIDKAELQAFAPLPASLPAKAAGPNAKQVELGRMLYYDARLSKSQTISCNSCHDLSKYGVDGEPTSPGFKGQRGDRNSPTVYNAAAHFVQFWDGRAADVEAQAKGPVLNPVEMALPNEGAAVAVLESIPEYVELFKQAFPNEPKPVTYDNMGKAIGAFERGLLTPSRWDKFLGGDEAALTAEEQEGAKKFVSAGCVACHSGALLGGHIYQRIGAMKPYPDQSDPGRFKVTKSESDKMMFKVPSLRNIAKTAPYFHNGKVAALNEAVSQMAEYQLGRQLTADEIGSIVRFLNTLTGDIPAPYIQKPALPPSTEKTPKPLAE
jgi:cytochrome c peroxidase